MAKLSIHPSDISALLGKYPEIELEILDKCTKNIAEQLYNKVTKEQTEKRIATLVNEILTEQTGYNQRKVTEPYSAMIYQLVKKFTQEHLDLMLGVQLRKTIDQEIRSLMPKLVKDLTTEMRTNINQMLRDELVQLLLTRDTSK